MFHGTVASWRCWYVCVVSRFVGSPCCVSPFKSWHVSLPAAILLNYELSDSITYCPSWEANSSSASQEIPRILWNPNVHCHAHTSPPHVLILSQMNPEIFALPWCYAACIGSYRRFGTNYRSHIGGSSSPRRMPATDASLARATNPNGERHVLRRPIAVHTIPRVTALLNVPAVLLGLLDPWRYVR
jgi:hypothetical protein